jgi:uncharacterized membrane protein
MTDRVVFEAVLQPNRPLSGKWAAYVLAGIALISFLVSISFVLRGAWPVTPFFGLDVALLAWAFRVTARRARRAERITLTPEQFTVRDFDEAGQERARDSLSTPWLHVEHHDPERLGGELAVANARRRLVIGKFLGPDERASLADALRGAISRLRGF